MNLLIAYITFIGICSVLGRQCTKDERCVPLLDCKFLLSANRETRKVNKCGLGKGCCPIIASRVGAPAKLEAPEKFPKDCGETPVYTDDRIVGGQLTNPDEYSWLASLEYQYSDTTAGICGGSVINARYVLTAAHCLVGQKIKYILGNVTSVRLGDFSKPSKCDYGQLSCQNFQRIYVEEQIVHKNYKRHIMKNDIALLRLKENIVFTATQKPICLPFAGSPLKEPPPDAQLVVAGWGLTETKNEQIAKRAVSISLWNKKKCLTDERRDASHICAGNAGRGSCHGDSGGPLMYKFDRKYMMLEGIVSYATVDCARSGFPTVFTRVRSFAKWIEEHMIMS